MNLSGRTISLLVALFLGAAGLTYLHATHPCWRKTIEFVGLASGVVVGVLSAFYIGSTLKDTLTQHEIDAKNRRLEVAFGFCNRWSEHEMRVQWMPLAAQLAKKSDSEIIATIESTPDNRRIAGWAVGFFEEIGYSVRTGRTDASHIRELMGTSVDRVYGRLEPWIVHYRRDNHQIAFAEHFEWFRNELRKKPLTQ